MLLFYRFCVDDPYDDDQDMVNISRIFHSVLVGSIHSHHDYHTTQLSQQISQRIIKYLRKNLQTMVMKKT